MRCSSGTYAADGSGDVQVSSGTWMQMGGSWETDGSSGDLGADGSGGTMQMRWFMTWDAEGDMTSGSLSKEM